ncbi:MAG: hypothetical protein ACE5HT_15675 [Gemmatimonadales bacterium]
MADRMVQTDTLRWLSILLVGLTAWVAFGCSSKPATHSIRGVWQVVERSFTRNGSTRIETNPQPGLYIFAERYFSVQEIRESGPRELFTAETSDPVRLAAFDVFHAHSGTYDATDSTLTIVPTLAKSPNSMDGSSYTYRLSYAGDSLKIKRVSEDGRETRVTTLVRIE